MVVLTITNAAVGLGALLRLRLRATMALLCFAAVPRPFARPRSGRPTGVHAFIIANADTLMSKFPADLMAEAFPTVEVRKKLGRHETRLSIKKDRRALGPAPEYSGREAKTNGMAQAGKAQDACADSATRKH